MSQRTDEELTSITNKQEASKYLHMTSPLKIQEDQTMLPGNFSVRERLQHKKKSDTR